MTRPPLAHDEPLVDAHCHIGRYPAGTLSSAHLIEEMDRNGVSVALVSPGTADNLEDIVAGNDAVIAAVRAYAGRLVGFGCVPLASGAAAREELKRTAGEGIVGLKVRPGLWGLAKGVTDLFPVVEVAAERRVPIYVHAGTVVRPVTADVVVLAKRFPELPFILSHRKSPSFREDLSLAAAECPNLLFDTSSITPANIRFLLERLGPERVVFGSGFPFGSQSMELSKAYKAVTPESVQMVFSGNIRRVLGACGVRTGA
jgi:predicted TIM-barrel fold metal-dependent hydrolase